ncbi:TetR/AcrR family transcriptional regulator [Frigoribacterium sp. 2-23]|uniref:TetR/AcrR family transcriptional regulator n=1 Tax=Frigoribacterium sp. 2-23 TaxID=3415006 RepID=UPI003C6FFBE2
MAPTDSAPVRAPRRDAAANRDALIAAAQSLLSRDTSASLEAIAAEAGLSRRSVYGHFATRDDLVREVTLRGAARVGAAVDLVRLRAGTASAVPAIDPLVELAALAARIWAEVENGRDMALLAVRGPLGREVAEVLRPLRSAIRALLRRGAASGRVRDDIPVETLARLVENAALAVLAESTHRSLSAREGHRLVMLSVLSVAGLDWREAGRLIETSPELSGATPGATSGATPADADATPKGTS